MSVLTKVLGDPNAREVKRHLEWVADVNELEPLLEKLTADELKARTAEFRQRLAQGEGLDQEIFQGLAAAKAGSELRRLGLQLRVGELAQQRLELIDLRDGLQMSFDLARVGIAEYGLQDTHALGGIANS